MTAGRRPNPNPWYRERWPWLVMAGPAIVIVAGALTTLIAFQTSDGLVAEDYYKRGLMVNQVMEREARARALGIAAAAMVNGERDAIRVIVTSAVEMPGMLRLTLVHPTRSNADQAVELRKVGSGVYEGRLLPLRNAKWRLSLEDAAGTWRLAEVPWRSD